MHVNVYAYMYVAYSNVCIFKRNGMTIKYILHAIERILMYLKAMDMLISGTYLTENY